MGGTTTGTRNVIGQIQAEDLSQMEIANVINHTFNFRTHGRESAPQALPKLSVNDELSIPDHEVIETRIQSLLATLNPSKPYGPDKIPNWQLEVYVKLIFSPVCRIINASFKELRVPRYGRWIIFYLCQRKSQ